MRYLLPILLCLLTACGEDAPDCLTATGSTTQVERQLEPYSEVQIDDNIDVFITSDKGSAVKVEAGENIISKITTEVKGGILYIQNENSCNWVRSARRQVKATVPVGDITFLIHYGAGELNTVGTLIHDSITLRHYGGGDAQLQVQTEYLNVATGNVTTMTLEGSVAHLVIYHNSLGKVDASRLVNMNAYADNMDHGEIMINTYNELYYRIRDKGNIRALQVPDSITMIGHSGEGKLILP